MNHAKRILQELETESGLTIRFVDQSRSLVGGRFQVQLLISVPIEIREDYLNGCLDSSEGFQAFSAQFGNHVRFEQTKVRNFIAEHDVETVLSQMKEEFLQSNLSYLNNPSFAPRYIQKEYDKWRKEQGWMQAHREAVRRIEGE